MSGLSLFARFSIPWFLLVSLNLRNVVVVGFLVRSALESLPGVVKGRHW